MEQRRLRIVVTVSAAESAELVSTLTALGHSVRAEEVESRAAAAALRAAEAEIAVIPRGQPGGPALRVVGALSHENLYPVVAVMPDFDEAWLEEAVAAGAGGVVAGVEPASLQIALRVSWQRFQDQRSLQDAFARRALIEQAKGLLMARYGIRSGEAFELLREHSQQENRKLVDLAAALVNAHPILTSVDALAGGAARTRPGPARPARRSDASARGG